LKPLIAPDLTGRARVLGAPRKACLLSVALALFAPFGCLGADGDNSVTVKVLDEQLHQIEKAVVGKFVFRLQKQAIGQIAFNEDASTVVLTPFSGRVTRLIAKVGDDIKEGDPLFEIDSPEVMAAQSDLGASYRNVEKARSAVTNTRRALDRLTSLLESRATSQREVDQARNDFNSADNDLKTNEILRQAARNKVRVLLELDDAEIDRVEKGFTKRLVTVKSPIGGTVVSRKIGPGQYVRADNGDQLFSISDLSTMWLKAFVPESDIPLVRVGQEIEVRVTAVPNQVFKARISAIGASSDAQTHRVTVRSEIANPDRKLRPEMFASFSIAVGDAAPSLSVPVAAIIRDGAGNFVWRLREGLTFERRGVRTGIELPDRIQVLEGLSEGDTVAGRGAIFIDNEVK
jgi:cobalt-zinc-cadmium efflux system membrane fusion protein